jgi:hypothetical protein
MSNTVSYKILAIWLLCISFIVIFWLSPNEAQAILNKNERHRKQADAKKNFLVIAQAQTPPPQTDIQQQHPDKTAGQRPEQQDAAIKPAELILIILNFLLFLAVAIQAWIYRQQLKVMHGQLAVMKETLAETNRIFDLTERPIIIAKAATIQNIASNRPLSPIVTFANKGRTMAQEFNITIEIAAHKGYMYIFGFGDTGPRPRGGHILPAGDEMSIQGAPADEVTLDDEFYNSAMHGRESFMIHGKGNYKDLAGREYQIHHAFRFRPDAGFVPEPYPRPMSDQPEETNT